MCWAGNELAGLQGETSGKFLCSGRWHKGRLSSAARGAPTACLSLAEQHKPSPPGQWDCPHPCPVAGCHPVLPKCCQHPDLAAGTHPPCPERPRVGQPAAHHPPRSHPMTQGFVLGGSVTSRCPRCILGFPLQISSSPRETGGDLVGLYEVMAHERGKSHGEGEGGPQPGLSPSPSISPPAGCYPEDAAEDLLRPWGPTGHTVPGRERCSASVSPQHHCLSAVPASSHQSQPCTGHRRPQLTRSSLLCLGFAAEPDESPPGPSTHPRASSFLRQTQQQQSRESRRMSSSARRAPAPITPIRWLASARQNRPVSPGDGPVAEPGTPTRARRHSPMWQAPVSGSQAPSWQLQASAQLAP